MALAHDSPRSLSSPPPFSLPTFKAGALAALLHSSRDLKAFEWTEHERPLIAHDQFEHNQLPVIDLSPLLALRDDHDPDARQKCLANMARASQEWGFFQVINHGVPLELIQEMEAHAKGFFRLNLKQKRKVLRSSVTGKPMGYTYGGVGTCLTSDFPWMEGLQLPAVKEEMEAFVWRIWQDGNEEFRKVAAEFSQALKALALELTEQLIKQLGVKSEPRSKLLKQGKNSVFRFNCYPPCPQPSLTLGLGAHSDPHVLTILHQDEVGGLQIFKDGTWIAVKPRADSLVINVGDVLQVWSNDIYKSVEHRAVCNSMKPRLSMAFFLNPTDDSTIAPAPELIDEARNSAHYRPFTWQEYRECMYAHRLRGKSNLLRFKLHDQTQ